MAKMEYLTVSGNDLIAQRKLVIKPSNSDLKLILHFNKDNLEDSIEQYFTEFCEKVDKFIDDLLMHFSMKNGDIKRHKNFLYSDLLSKALRALNFTCRSIKVDKNKIEEILIKLLEKLDFILLVKNEYLNYYPEFCTFREILAGVNCIIDIPFSNKLSCIINEKLEKCIMTEDSKRFKSLLPIANTGYSDFNLVICKALINRYFKDKSKTSLTVIKLILKQLISSSSYLYTQPEVYIEKIAEYLCENNLVKTVFIKNKTDIRNFIYYKNYVSTNKNINNLPFTKKLYEEISNVLEYDNEDKFNNFVTEPCNLEKKLNKGDFINSNSDFQITYKKYEASFIYSNYLLLFKKNSDSFKFTVIEYFYRTNFTNNKSIDIGFLSKKELESFYEKIYQVLTSLDKFNLTTSMFGKFISSKNLIYNGFGKFLIKKIEEFEPKKKKRFKKYLLKEAIS